MDDTRTEQEVAALGRRLSELGRMTEELNAALAREFLHESDDDNLVTATVNGHGELVDLRIDDSALEYPSRLGALITSAVSRARSAGAAMAEAVCRDHLPELPSIRDLETELSVPDGPVDYHAIEYSGSSQVRNTIAEGIEKLQKIQQARADFEGTRLQQEIGFGAGVAEINAASSYLKVSIASEAAGQLGAQRLAGQVLDAIRTVEAQAYDVRARSLAE